MISILLFLILLSQSLSAEQQVKFINTIQGNNQVAQALDDPIPRPSQTASQWKSRSIYQILVDRFAHSVENKTQPCRNLNDYCGGTFKGIQRNLEHIQSMGFDAIWISPVVENTEHGYHGYWAKNLYEINSHFGTAQELKDLVRECHRRGIWVMLDVVANHMGNTFDDFKQFHPFRDSSNYHNYCLIRNYNNQHEVEYCRIGDVKSSLADLNTESTFVQKELNKWLRWIVQEFDFDAIRIDTVKHVPMAFWPTFTQGVPVFSIGEVLQGDPAYVGPYQRVMDSLLNFPMYFTIRDVFGTSRQSMWNFEVRFEQNLQYFKDVSLLGNFVDNHDLKRFLNEQKDLHMLKSALVFTMLAQGIPVVYQGTEYLFSGGDDPRNRESMWPQIHERPPELRDFFYRINRIRKIAGQSFVESNQRHVWTNDDLYAFLRGEVLVVLTNGGQYRSFDRKIKIPLKANYIDILSPDAKPLEYVGMDGGGGWLVNLKISSGRPQVFYPREKLLPHWKDFFTTFPSDDK